jgi:hypothetical protein
MTMSQQARPADDLDRRRPRSAWSGYVAAAWAALFGLVSLYWAVGGTIGIATIGSQVVGMAGGSGGLLIWGAVVLKFAGAIFALALVGRWGRVFPRPLMLVVGYAAGVLLMIYGAVNIVGELLVVTGAVAGVSGADAYALHWHLALWDPSFLLWGVLLFLATRCHARTTRRA